ncbi:MAG: hypothetical protein EBS52_01980 [Betaproteobacteria bacterium]|nr:hypothetical protein [Betaproteobacteria bacterium]
MCIDSISALSSNTGAAPATLGSAIRVAKTLALKSLSVARRLASALPFTLASAERNSFNALRFTKSMAKPMATPTPITTAASRLRYRYRRNCSIVNRFAKGQGSPTR